MIRTRWIVLLMGLLIGSACTPTLEVGIEPTATPEPTLTSPTPQLLPEEESTTWPTPGTLETPLPSENETILDSATDQKPSPTAYLLVTGEPTITPGPSPTPILLSSSETLRYTSSSYPLAFSYLPNWTISREETNGVELARGALTLRIAFRWNSEEVDLSGGRSGMPAGDWVYRDKVDRLESGDAGERAAI